MFSIECAKQLCCVHIYIPKTFSERFIYIFGTFSQRQNICERCYVIKRWSRRVFIKAFVEHSSRTDVTSDWIACRMFIAPDQCTPLRIVFTQHYQKFELLCPFSGFMSKLFSKLNVMHRKIKTYQMCLFWHGRIWRHRVRHMATKWRH